MSGIRAFPELFHVEHFFNNTPMEKNIFFEDINSFETGNDIFKKLDFLIENENKKEGEINFIFCSDNYLLDMNKTYLKHDYFTDVITFDYCENEILSGDIFISIDRIKENAKLYNVSFNQELHRVMIHGLLHLVGYNDKTDEEQKEMTDKENEYLFHE